MPEFSMLDEAMRYMRDSMQAVIAYDLDKRHCMSLSDAYQAASRFPDPEHQRYRWFLPNTYRKESGGILRAGYDAD